MADHGRVVLHVCGCSICRSRADSDTVEYHRCINRVVRELDERGRRLFAGLLASQMGRGGIQRLVEITGLNRMTIRRGRRELGDEDQIAGRARRPGGGRHAVEKKVPNCCGC